MFGANCASQMAPFNVKVNGNSIKCVDMARDGTVVLALKALGVMTKLMVSVN